MKNIFQLTDEEERQLDERLRREKEEFESLNLDYYKNFEYGHFTEFISSMEHYVQSYGHENFVYEYVTEERLAAWKLHETLFVVGYVEYLCNKYNIKEPKSIKKYKDKKMDKLLFHHGLILMMHDGMYGRALECYKDGVKELLQHNIVLGTVEDVV